jgi:large subunit ribosomal protein L21e
MSLSQLHRSLPKDQQLNAQRLAALICPVYSVYFLYFKMPHSFGYRARTRDMFAKSFRKHGVHELSKYFITYKVGDVVDIKADGAVHKGMPHKFYHGRTGIVFNVTQTSVGVEVNKEVRGKILKKRVHFRIEHVRPSRSREDFIKRVKENTAKKAAAKAAGTKVLCKRLPGQPRGGSFVKVKSPVETIMPAAYEFLV